LHIALRDEVHFKHSPASSQLRLFAVGRCRVVMLSRSLPCYRDTYWYNTAISNSGMCYSTGGTDDVVLEDRLSSPAHKYHIDYSIWERRLLHLCQWAGQISWSCLFDETRTFVYILV